MHYWGLRSLHDGLVSCLHAVDRIATAARAHTGSGSWGQWRRQAVDAHVGVGISQGWEHAYNVTNVEYTEFEKLGISDECAHDSQYSRFPANTNVLYVGLQVAAFDLTVTVMHICKILHV